METIPRATTISVTHSLPLMSIVAPYFGYVNECAELMMQLDKKSRELWLGNLKAILQVIMDYRQCTLVKEICKSFNKTVAKKLLPARNYCYFTMKVRLGSEESFKAMIMFMDQMGEITLKYQFEEVFIELENYTSEVCNKFLEKYIEKGFDKKAIIFDYEPTIKVMKTSPSELRYINLKSFNSKTYLYLTKADRMKYLSNSQEIEKLCIHQLNFDTSLLDKNFNCLSISPEILNDSLGKFLNYKFTNKSCKTIEFYQEGRFPRANIKGAFKYLDRFSYKLPNLEKFQTEATVYFQYIASRSFFQNNEEYQNLSKIKNFSFQSDMDEDRVNLDMKYPKVEIVYQSSKESSIKVFVVSNLEVKLMSDEFFYDPDNKIIILQRPPSYLSFKNIKICTDQLKIAEYKNIIEDKVYLKFPKNDLIIHPKGKVKQYKNNLMSRRYENLPMVSYKSIISKSRPHYIFNTYVEPIKSNASGIEKECKVDLANIRESLSDVPSNGVVSIYIHTYFVHVDHWEQVEYRISNSRKLKDDNGKVAKEFTCIDANEGLCLLFDALKTLNLYEFRCESIIDDDAVVQKFCELCESNLTIRDIELNLVHAAHAKQILEALKDNYVIKTVRLMTEEAIKASPQNTNPTKLKKSKKKSKAFQKSEDIRTIQLHNEIIEYCDEFRSKRLGTEIMLNTTHKKYKPWEKKGFQLSYKQ
ncbi:unnamed protein product [Moneuplotes crassus]|uniref:Uncharacterized protein n=1 Tax=Euplotes crassus TaxID=5936 RepID=A0AAD1U227_EUPCR|nr:unnamed protein product [Moneuplotes crassus]